MRRTFRISRWDREGATPSSRREARVHFNRLDEGTRKILSDACNGDGDPRTVAWSPYSGGNAVLQYLFRGSVGMSAGLGRLVVGLGMLGLWGYWFATTFDAETVGGRFFGFVVQPVLAGVGSVFVFSSLHRRGLRTLLPFSAGTYVFRGEVLVATRSVLRLIPLDDLKGIRADARADKYGGSLMTLHFFQSGMAQLIIHDRDEEYDVANKILVAAGGPSDPCFAALGEAASSQDATRSPRHPDGSTYRGRILAPWAAYPLTTAGLVTALTTAAWFVVHLLLWDAPSP
ncbi:MAG: hypothetical protein AAGE52_19815 [Myxococcota bacterium]